jgi:UPF0755 protein
MRRILSIIGILIFILGLLAAGLAYFTIFYPNVPESTASRILYIEKKQSIKSLSKELADSLIIIQPSTFEWVSKLMQYDSLSMKTGKYAIPGGLNNRELVSLLRSGRQVPVDLTFNNVRNIEELAGKITSDIQLDSLQFLEGILNYTVLDSLSFTQEDVLTLFIPNTYEVFWNIPFKSLLNRMRKEHKRFWNPERIKKAKALNLTPKQVYIMASIVEKETIAESEKATIAGVYYNRLQKNMLLQADPTVVFANGDFELRRVLNKHLEIDSPYNTYKYPGLPPGPIYMPDISTIDAVLNLEKHKYLYFCAKPDDSGLHAFAKTSAQHAANARKFHAWLNKQNIYR